MDLKERLNGLAVVFADSVMEAIRSVSIDELTQQDGGTRARVRKTDSVLASDPPLEASFGSRKRTKPAKSGRLPRRSIEEIAKVVDKVATLLRASKGGLRSEFIKEKLGLDVREVPRILKDGVKSKKFAVLSGQKRATVYGIKATKTKTKVVKAAPKKKAPKKTPTKKAAKKVAKKASAPVVDKAAA